MQEFCLNRCCQPAVMNPLALTLKNIWSCSSKQTNDFKLTIISNAGHCHEGQPSALTWCHLTCT